MSVSKSDFRAAIRSENITQLHMLFEQDSAKFFEFNYVTGHSSILHEAPADTCSVKILASILAMVIDVNSIGKKDGETPLVWAASSGIPEKVRYLLDQGAILQTEKSIQNPLFGAIAGCYSIGGRDLPRENFSKIARMLLDAGIDATVRYDSPTMIDMDAMAFARMWGRWEIANMIAAHLHPDDPAGQAAAIERAIKSAQITADHNDRIAKAEQAAEDAEYSAQQRGA